MKPAVGGYRLPGGEAPPPTDRSWFVSLLGTSVLLLSAVNGLRPILSYRALALGATPFELGVLVSTFALLPLLLAVAIGQRTDQVGERRMILRGATIVTVAAVLGLVAPNLLVLAVANALLGLGHTFFAVGSQSLIANASRASERDARYGSYAVGVSVAQFAGPLLAGVLGGSALGPGGPGRAFVVAAIMALGASLIAWGIPPRHRRAPPRSSRRVRSANAMGILRRPGMPAAMLAGIAVLTSADLLLVYLPAYGTAQGLSIEAVGFLLAAQGVAAILSRLALPLLVARGWRRIELLAGGMTLAAAGFATIPLATGFASLLLVIGVIGFGLGFGQPLTLAWVAETAAPLQRATTLAVRLTGNRLGQLTLPAAMGGLGGALGLATIFVATAGLLGLAVTMALRERNLQSEVERS